MKTFFIFTFLFSISTVAATSSEIANILGGTPYSLAQSMTFAENQRIYSEYCLGVSRSTDIPVPNYANPEVQQAARHLSKAKKEAFYFYRPIREMYKLNDKTPIPQIAELPELTLQTHMLLVQLCGEFRDRATLIKSKIDWYKNLYVLPAKNQGAINPQKNVWSQITASSYAPYLTLTRQLWEDKRNSQPRYIKIGSANVDNPVPGTTVCETKYIFSEYISKNKPYDGLEKYKAGLTQYQSQCLAEDITDYYDFRGDSNIKHNSPESNAMIWFSSSIASACKTMTQAKSNSAGITDQDCKNYFENPFYFRYNAARAGLATWLFHSPEHHQKFGSSKSEIAIFPHQKPYQAPMSFGFDHQKNDLQLNDFDLNWLNIPGAWASPDIGFNAYTGLGTAQPDAFKVYDLIRAAVDRHTDWYASSYNDSNGSVRDQAYSPLVASSYVMSASDQFTFCGITVPCPADGHKRWMFIFRVKAENWYTPARALKSEPLDFDKMWFDETSFGETGLANGERAWDRLGTPLEGEMDSILYLYNISDSGSLIDPTSPDIIEPVEDGL